MVGKWKESRKDRLSFCAYRYDINMGAILFLRNGARLRSFTQMEIYEDPPKVWTLGSGLSFRASRAHEVLRGVDLMNDVYELSHERELQGKVLYKMDVGRNIQGYSDKVIYFWIQNLHGTYYYKMQLFRLESIRKNYQATRRVFQFPLLSAEKTLENLRKVLNKTVKAWERQQEAVVEVPIEVESEHYERAEIIDIGKSR